MSERKTSIGILGGGYLGQRLVAAFDCDKYDVSVSYRSKPINYKKSHVKELFVELNKGQINGDLSLFSVDCLIICVPPGFRKGMGNFYALDIKSVAQQAYKQGVKQLIFTSSTAIYEQSGICDENTAPLLQGNKAKVLYDAEQAVISSGVKSVQVLRLAGLMGPNRHPGRFNFELSAENAMCATNMIMIQDVVSVIAHLVETPCPQKVLNLVASHHPQKQTFYRYARGLYGNAQQDWLFAGANEIQDKVVISRHLPEFGVNLKYQNLFSALRTIS